MRLPVFMSHYEYICSYLLNIFLLHAYIDTIISFTQVVHINRRMLSFDGTKETYCLWESNLLYMYNFSTSFAIDCIIPYHYSWLTCKIISTLKGIFPASIASSSDSVGSWELTLPPSMKSSNFVYTQKPHILYQHVLTRSHVLIIDNQKA